MSAPQYSEKPLTTGTVNREGQQPKYKAILIGGPNDGQTYGLHEDRAVLMVMTPEAIARIPLGPVRPEEFGLKPDIAQYVCKRIADAEMMRSKVLTYFFYKLVQNAYD